MHITMQCYLRAVVYYCFLFGALETNSLRQRSKEETCKQLCTHLGLSQTENVETQDFINCLQSCLIISTKNTVKIPQLDVRDPNVRSKREVSTDPEEMGCTDMFKSASPFNYVGIPDSIDVKFAKTIVVVNGSEVDRWAAIITWSPIPNNQTSKNWTHYLVQWDGGKENGYLCRLVSKNKTSLILNKTTDWEYPNLLELNVSTYPMSDQPYRLGYTADPRDDIYFKPVTLPPDVSFNKLTAILLGVMAGVLLVITIVVWIIRRRLLSRDLEDVWISHIRKLPRKARNRIRSTESELTIVEDTNHYYISYYPESEEYTELVVKFACFLRELNYDVIMDRMSAGLPEEGPIRWVQLQISISSKVIVLCSPNYLRICQKCPNSGKPKTFVDENESRVWYEIEMLGNIYTQRRNANKMVCIWMNKGIPEGLPPWLHVTYTWPADYETIFARLDDVHT